MTPIPPASRKAEPMTAKTPAAQGISALLTDAGFELGVDGRLVARDVDGYYVTENRVGDGMVLVSYWGPEAEYGEMLARYTKAIEAAGYRVRRADDSTYLIVTAKTEEV